MSAIPPITIGLPVYNREKYLRTALDSLLNQTFGDFELVICDNASTDSTPTIAQDYAERDKRVRFYRNDVNIGANRNFNRVFHLSRGKYLKWSTSDDFWALQTTERLFPIMESDPEIVLCYPKTMICDAAGIPIEPYEDNLHLMENSPSSRFMNLLARIGLCHQHLGLIRRDMLARTRLLGDHIACDANLLAELTLYGKFYECPERMFFRRFHPESSSAKKGPDPDAMEQTARLHRSSPSPRCALPSLEASCRVRVGGRARAACPEPSVAAVHLAPSRRRVEQRCPCRGDRLRISRESPPARSCTAA